MKADKSPPSPEDMQLAGAIYEQHKGIMLMTAAEYLNDTSLVNDVVHDAVIRLAQYAPTLRQLSESARARYARETVRSVAINCERQLGIERKYAAGAWPGDEGESDSPEGAFIRRSEETRRLACLRQALDELEENDRELLTGKYILGQSDEQLAARFGLKPAALRMRLTRARRRLRHAIERKEGDGGKT